MFKMAKLFETSVPTTQNVSRLRKVFSESTEQMNTVGNIDVAPFTSVNRPPIHKVFSHIHYIASILFQSRLPHQGRAVDDGSHRRVGFAPSFHRRSRSTGHSRH
jgi:hypothetical protein